MLKGEQKSGLVAKRGVDPNKNKKKKSGLKAAANGSNTDSSKRKKKGTKRPTGAGEVSTAKRVASPDSCLQKASRTSRLEQAKTEQSSCFKPLSSVLKTKTAEEKTKGSKKAKESKSPPIEQPEQAAATAWVKETLEKSVGDLAGEYQPNPAQYEQAVIASSVANHEDNRYKNMPCLEKTRVKVVGAKTDYINANYVGSSENPKRFICAQGPLDHTVEKFWRMVIADGCEVIVMLCDLTEGGSPKCAKYYPDEQSKSLTFGPVTVKCCGLSVDGGIVTTLLEVTLGQEKACVVRHSKIVEWPDHGVPGTTKPLLTIIHRTRASKKPVVIHCSAGIGRTGTCVLVAMAQQELRRGNFSGMWPLLQRIREQRAFSVQNSKQYVFAYLCLLDRANNNGLVEKAGLDLEKFQNEYKLFLAASSRKKKAKSTEAPAEHQAAKPAN